MEEKLLELAARYRETENLSAKGGAELLHDALGHCLLTTLGIEVPSVCLAERGPWLSPHAIGDGTCPGEYLAFLVEMEARGKDSSVSTYYTLLSEVVGQSVVDELLTRVRALCPNDIVTTLRRMV